MAKTRRQRVVTVIKRASGSVRRGASRARSGVRRFGGVKRQGEGYLSIKQIVMRKGAVVLGAGIDVATEVISAATDNTYDDALTSAPAKLAIGLGIDFLLGRKAQHITSGMLGSAAGQMMRKIFAK